MTENEQIAINTNEINNFRADIKDINKTLHAMEGRQINEVTALMSCKNELEKELQMYMKENYQSLSKAELMEERIENKLDSLGVNINHKFKTINVVMVVLFNAGAFLAWALNYFNLV